MISSTRWCLVMLISMMLFVGSSASWTPANYHVVDDDYPLYDSDEGYGDWRIHKVSQVEKDAEIYERYLKAKIKKNKEEATKMSFVVTNAGIEEANGTYVRYIEESVKYVQKDAPNDGFFIVRESNKTNGSYWSLKSHAYYKLENYDGPYSRTSVKKTHYIVMSTNCVPPRDGWEPWAEKPSTSEWETLRFETSGAKIGEDPGTAPKLTSYKKKCGKPCGETRYECMMRPDGKKCRKYKETGVHFLPCPNADSEKCTSKKNQHAVAKFKCILPNGPMVAYRKSKNGAKTKLTKKGGDVVDAVFTDGNWFQAMPPPAGEASHELWLPIELASGQVLFKEVDV